MIYQYDILIRYIQIYLYDINVILFICQDLVENIAETDAKFAQICEKENAHVPPPGDLICSISIFHLST